MASFSTGLSGRGGNGRATGPCGDGCSVVLSYTPLRKSEREKPHGGETNQHAPTQTPCNQPAIAALTHTDSVQTQHTTSIATNSAPYTCLITTSALALQARVLRTYSGCTAATVRTLSHVFVRSVMACWLHGICVSACRFVPPHCGFSLSLFCNYSATIFDPLHATRTSTHGNPHRHLTSSYVLVCCHRWARHGVFISYRTYIHGDARPLSFLRRSPCA